MMKLTMVMAMLASSLQLAAQTKYEVVTLPDLGASGQANSINNRGWVAGGVNLPGGVYSEATAWINGSLVRLGTLGGPNSLVAWPVANNDGVIAGISEVSALDTLGENGSSCQYFFPTDPPSGHACQGFRWQNGVMTALPTLGGTNSYATGANNQGQIVGWAENTVHDSTCAGSQLLQFRAVIWGPRPGQIQELPPLPGDSVSAATAINDKGQVVGISGDCDIAFGRFSAAMLCFGKTASRLISRVSAGRRGILRRQSTTRGPSSASQPCRAMTAAHRTIRHSSGRRPPVCRGCLNCLARLEALRSASTTRTRLSA